MRRFVTGCAAYLGLSTMLAFAACRQAPESGAGAAGTAQTASAPLVSATDSMGSLIHRLRTATGTFQREGDGAYRLSGDRGLLEAMRAFGDSAVSRLVACLDDTTTATATLDDRPVTLGVMCNEALRAVAYYEATDQSGGLTSWPGSVDARASVDQLVRAKQAWQQVVRRRAYVLYGTSRR